MNFVEISLSDGTVTSMIMHRLSFLSLMTLSGLFASIALSMCTGISQSIVTTCQFLNLVSPTNLAMNVYCRDLLCREMYSFLANSGQPKVMWLMNSSHYY